MDTLADMVKRKRLTNGQSQSQAALQMGVSQTTLARWELGEAVPNARSIPRIARYLGVKPTVVVDLVMEPRPAE